VGHFEAPGGTGVKFNADDTNGLRDCRCGQPLLIYPYKQPGGASGAGTKNPGRIFAELHETTIHVNSKTGLLSVCA
jgi:hypothetical protein